METIKIVLNDIDYVTRNDKPIIRLFGINPETEENVIAVDTTFKPYLYVLPYDFDICLEDLREMGLDDLEVETKIDIGTEREFIKVILTHPQEVPKLRDSIRDLPSVKQIREYDIPFYRRYLIDKQITPTNIIELHGETIDSILYSEELKIDEDVTLFKMMENPIDTHKTNKRNKILSFDIEVYNAEGMWK